MNNFTANVSNKIKRPPRCCIYCGKTYVNTLSLDKHILHCELLHTSKKSSHELDTEETIKIPSQKQLFQMVLALTQKCNKLEDKIHEMSKYIVKEKKKINPIDWLQANRSSIMAFEEIIHTIFITDKDMLFLQENSYNDLLNEIFARSIYKNDGTSPIYAFSQKMNKFYMYDSENIWQELSREKLLWFLNKIYYKIFKFFNQWRITKKNEISDNDQFTEKCDKTFVKLTSIEYTDAPVLTKTRNMIYQKMKIDLDDYGIDLN